MTQPLLLAVPDSDIAPVTEGAVAEAAPDKAERLRKIKEIDTRSKIAELLFLRRGVELGYNVKWMQGNCKNYDIILERDGMRPLFVQVKYAVPTLGNYYNICNCSGDKSRAYSSMAYDVLAVYLWDRGEWVLYTRAELGNRTFTTYTPPEHRQMAVRSNAPDARDPDNWDLLNQVAESLTANQNSFAA